MLRRIKFCQLMMASLLVGGGLSSASAQTLVERVVKVREGATASYERDLRIACPVDIVEKALDHPAVMGAVWKVFGFTPEYRVSALERASDLHVEDPTGIVGDGWLVATGPGRRVFLGQGKIDHWAVPMLNEGSIVIEVEFEARGASTQISVAVFVRPESWIAGAVVGAFSGVVEQHVGLRVTANAIDVRTILEAITGDPEGVASRLDGSSRADFETVFSRGS